MKNNPPKQLIKNAHLKGDPFLWKAGSTGVLLVHGFTATTAEVRPLAKALVSNDFTVSGPVLPGHNSYPDEINQFTWQDWADAVEKAYIELTNCCDRVFVGGESTGGLLALNLALKYRNISGLLTYAPALKLTIRRFDQLLLRISAPFIPYLNKNDNDDGLAWKGYTVNPLKGVIQLLKLQKQVYPQLQQIYNPILIVQGKLDLTVDKNVPQTIYNCVNSSLKEIHWMEKSRHCVILDHEFDQVVDITKNFLEKVMQ
jgi:carboxylesterase